MICYFNMSNISANNKLIAKNTLFLYVRTFISICITLFTSRIFLNQLGIEDYGIYNLVGGVVSLFSVLTSFMANSTQRFLSIALGKNDIKQLYKVLNISITLTSYIMVLLFLIGEIGGLLLLKYYVNIPEGKEFVTYFVFHFSIITAALSILKVPFNALILAKEKMSFYAYLSIFEVIVKLIITISLFIVANKLCTFSVLQCFSTILLVIAIFVYCKKKLGIPNYKRYNFLENPEYTELISFSSWTLIGNSSTVARDHGLGIILNRFYGVTLNASMGIVIQILNIFSSLFINLQSAFRSQIIQSSVSRTDGRYQRLINLCGFYSIVFMGIVCIPMTMSCRTILTLWLGTVPKYTVELVQIAMAKVLFSSISQCVFISLETNAKIKVPHIITFIFATLTLFCVNHFLAANFEPYWVMMIVVTMEVVILILNFLYSKKVNSMSVSSFLKYNIRPLVFVITTWICSIQISQYTISNTSVLISLIVFFILYINIVYYLLEKSQRIFISAKIKESIQKLKRK